MALSPDHANALRIRDVYTKWFPGVASPMLQFLSDDVIFHLPGSISAAVLRTGSTT